MNKIKTDEAIRLTQEMLESYWQHDYQFAISHMADDVMWIGCTRDQFICGKELVEEDFRKVDQELQSCHLMAQEYVLVSNQKDSCSIAGRYLVTTDPETEVFLQVQQRCLAVWEQKDGQLVLKALHVSNPMGELNLVEDEKFPNHLGRRAYQYLIDHLNRDRDDHKFMVTDIKRVTHFIYESEIEYLEAVRHACKIHLSDGVIHINVSITDILEQHPDWMVRVHRSYAVNPMKISHMYGNKIVMNSGKEVRIADKKQTETFNEIAKFMEAR